MRLDGANFQFFVDPSNPVPTAVDLQSLVLHELGHVLGLAHNTMTDSVMQASLASGQIRETPGTTDINDLKCGY
jgi:predicted Zn-dependent protease